MKKDFFDIPDGAEVMLVLRVLTRHSAKMNIIKGKKLQYIRAMRKGGDLVYGKKAVNIMGAPLHFQGYVERLDVDEDGEIV